VDFKQIGPLSQTFLEAYWTPGFDWNPGKIGFLRALGRPLLDPLSNDQRTGVFQSAFCGNASDRTCDSLLNGTKLFNQGNYDKNRPTTASSAFVSTSWPLHRMEHQLPVPALRSDGSPVAIVRGIPLDQEVYVPEIDQRLDSSTYCDGLAYNGDDPDIAAQIPWPRTSSARSTSRRTSTPSVFRSTVRRRLDADRVARRDHHRLRPSFYDGDKQVALYGRAPNGPTLLPGITKRNMWKGMLAFDRPTWIRWLNKKTTFFLSGQMFWHYIIDMEKRRCAINDQPEYLQDGLEEPQLHRLHGQPHRELRQRLDAAAAG